MYTAYNLGIRTSSHDLQRKFFNPFLDALIFFHKISLKVAMGNPGPTN